MARRAAPALSLHQARPGGLEPGGYFIVTEGGWFSSRSVELRAGASGGVVRKYSVGLREQPYEPAGREFLAEMLPKLFDMGLAARSRVTSLLRRRGPPAVMTAIERLRTDYVRRIYYTHLFELGNLDAKTAALALTRAGAQMSSDYEKAELLRVAAPLAVNETGGRSAYLQMAAGITSDYEKRRELDAALDRGTLGPAGTAELLDAAFDIDSDYELAELLIDVARVGALDPTTRPAFFRAARSVDSDEHRRVLATIAGQPGQDGETGRQLLESASGIASPYEKAEFLLQWLGAFSFEALAAPFIQQAATIPSSYERGRVLSAVVEQPHLASPALKAVLTAAADLGGDYELSQLLQRTARRHPIAGDVREAYLAAADRMKGGHEKDQVYAALVKAERGRVQ